MTARIYIYTPTMMSFVHDPASCASLSYLMRELHDGSTT